MSKHRNRQRPAPQRRDSAAGNSVALWLSKEDIFCEGYTRLSDCPEIQTACLRIAELIGSMTIHLLENTAEGDKRITNELSRMIDITPWKNMTRTPWMTAIVMNLLLYGRGNSIVMPHTHGGLLTGLEPIAADRVSFRPLGTSRTEYQVILDGVPRDPAELLHFAYNPDPHELWRGQGVTVTLRDVAANLKQGQKTENAFMSSEWKPSIIVKVSGLSADFQTPEGRSALLADYINPQYQGQPWIIPGELFDIQQVKPLTLADLAIRDTMELDKRAVASVIGVPPFLLGVGEFKRDEWNAFIQGTVRTIALIIQQEMTRALILSPKWYLQLNYWSLLDYDLGTVSQILLAGADRGYVCGDEWRDRMHLPPAGLREYRVLENYIPSDMAG
jgi:HK97 family phage portal protein